MTSREFPLPEAVRLRAVSLGEAGTNWIAGLGAAAAELEEKWSIRIGAVLTGGSESLVVEAQREDGALAVLKLGLPGSADLAMEARVFELADGRGYAELFAQDAQHNALLLEKLGEPLGRMNLPTRRQIEQICTTLESAWLPLDASQGLMTGAEKARWLADFIIEQWQAQNRPCNRQTVDRAMKFAGERESAHSTENSVLVHGDAHVLNTLNTLTLAGTPNGSFKFVDPDGLFAERACDLAVPMREWNEELLGDRTAALARARCELLTELTGVESRAIWQWGFMERLSTGLVLLSIGMQEEGRQYLEVADRLCGERVD